MHRIPVNYVKPDEIIKDSPNEESIYRIIKSAPPIEKKEKRYVSKYKDIVIREYFNKIGSNQTMGYEKVPLPSPQNFLKKHSKEPVLPPRKLFKYPDGHRTPVISIDISPISDLPVKNFLVENVRNAIQMTPPKLIPRQVYNRFGDCMELEPSGLLPKYFRKKEYGLIPKYLIKRNYDLLISEMMINKYINEEYHKSDLPKITENEKECVLRGLRKNWNKLNSIYLSLPLVPDTLRKIWTKEELERRLGQLERDIDLISKYENIRIAPSEENL
ncbi:enkurin [Centruroides vittatus]|uniref:enkurin n=1 Tax=Centruroides vittatus TaxID=120091 RepID=UPI00350EF4BF